MIWLSRLAGWLWRLVWAPTLRYTRNRLELELNAAALAKGLTATPPMHLWYERGMGWTARAGYAPPDVARPYRLRGLDLNLCVHRLHGTVTHRGKARAYVRRRD